MAGRVSKRTTRSARRFTLAALLAVLAIGVGAWAASAASAPSTPSLAATPNSSPTNSTTESFTYTSSGAVSFLCKLDNAGSLTSCPAAGTRYTSLAAGSHTFQVVAADKNGHTSSPASYSWVIDTTAPPLPSIGAKPSNPSAVTSASFAFTESEGGASLLCKIDTAAYAACTSPSSYSGLALGSHSFSVEARDAAGNVSAPVSYAWSIVPPTPTLGATPANPTSRTSAGFSFTDTLAGVSYVCALDTASFSACSSPQNYAGALTQGTHTFQVRAVSGANQSAPASYTWAVDTTAPATPSLTAKPASLSNTTSASFSFTDTEAGVGFLCRLDAGAYLACTNPTGYARLAQGAHSFSVEARDAAGNVGNAAAWSWTIDSVAPAAPVLTYKPNDPNGDGIANFDWTAETGATFRCSIENRSFTACPLALDHLAHYIVDVSSDGTHQFAVIASDAAGNNSSTTSYSWQVQHAINVVVDGNAVGLLYPGGPARQIALVLHNPNNFPVAISLISVSIGASPAGCSATNVALGQSNVGNGTSPQTVTVAAKTNLALPAANRPTIRLVDLGNQDACKNKTFTLTYLAKGSK